METDGCLGWIFGSVFRFGASSRCSDLTRPLKQELYTVVMSRFGNLAFRIRELLSLQPFSILKPFARRKSAQ